MQLGELFLFRCHVFLFVFSQMFILPPFQKKGLGAEMLQGIYNYYTGRRDVIDITGKLLIMQAFRVADEVRTPVVPPLTTLGPFVHFERARSRGTTEGTEPVLGGRAF